MNEITSILLSALAGGVICAAVQLLIDFTRLTPARILVCLVTLGVVLFAVGAYEPLYKIFGAGVSVPLLGFGATIGRGVREAVGEVGLLGALTGGLTASAAGISLSLFLGLFFSLFFRGRAKRM
ncbi:MAG: SpoVA/SpoVAEb family sporulation membrane protein [Clostridia bacterium]|nr:SpoVA/SpoVAEb family sporulation membrane protein [Clostridia bacterium]